MSQYDSMKNLNHCWVCDDVSSLHEHHIIPQAYGGVDGPTVTLCATCHNGVHHVADGRADMRPSSWVTPERNRKGTWLSDTIVKARVLASTSDNKQAKVILELSANETKMLDQITQAIGSTSRVKTLKELIHKMHQRLTI